MREQLKWHDEKADNSPWLNALAELRQRATREGYALSKRRGDSSFVKMEDKPFVNVHLAGRSGTSLGIQPGRQVSGISTIVVSLGTIANEPNANLVPTDDALGW
jgi:hypothetical protein